MKSSFVFAFLGMWETVIILAVCLMFFGAKKLPELARGLGHGIREFKKATREVTDDLQRAIDEDPAQQRKLTSTEKEQAKDAVPVKEQSKDAVPPTKEI